MTPFRSPSPGHCPTVETEPPGQEAFLRLFAPFIARYRTARGASPCLRRVGWAALDAVVTSLLPLSRLAFAYLRSAVRPPTPAGSPRALTIIGTSCRLASQRGGNAAPPHGAARVEEELGFTVPSKSCARSVPGVPRPGIIATPHYFEVGSTRRSAEPITTIALAHCGKSSPSSSTAPLCGAGHQRLEDEPVCED